MYFMMTLSFVITFITINMRPYERLKTVFEELRSNEVPPIIEYLNKCIEELDILDKEHQKELDDYVRRIDNTDYIQAIPQPYPEKDE